MKEKIIFLRHGESIGNTWKPAYEDDNINFLSPLGIKQAEIAGILLKRKFNISLPASSALTRSRQTLNLILNEYGNWKQKFIIEPNLNEIVPKGYGLVNEESVYEHYDRVVEGFKNIISQWETGNLLLVTHYHTMNALFRHLKINYNELSLGDYIPNAVHFIYDIHTNSIDMMDMYKSINW